MIFYSHSDGVVLTATARHHHWQGQGMMSIKCFFGGDARYRVDNGYHIVGNNTYFLLNDQQEYEIIIDESKPLESFCIFLPASILQAIQSHDLDNPIPQSPPQQFFERVYPHDAVLMPALLSLRQQIRYLNAFELDEKLHDIAQCVIIQHHNTRNTVNDLPLARASTRDEIYRRVYRARDTMLALLDQPLTLDELASVATMSPNHFLRSFKQIFHESPHQYLRRHRLEKAQYLLDNTSLSVTEICFAVGFESLGSFSWAFRQYVGKSPSDYRKVGDFEEAISS